MRRAAWTAVAVLLSAVGRNSARADPPASNADDSPKVETLEKRFAADLAAHADDRLRDDMKEAKTLARSISDAALADRCTVAVGKVTEGTSHDDVRTDALRTLGQIGRAAGSPYVAPFLVQRGTDQRNPLTPIAIEAAGHIRSDDLVSLLMTLVDKSHVILYAVVAIKALGEFGNWVSRRVGIVERLIDSVRGDVRGSGPPGVTDPPGAWGRPRLLPNAGENTQGFDRNRYEALAPAMRVTCNRLTGQNVATPEEWFKLRDEYKGRMELLFPPAPK